MEGSGVAVELPSPKRRNVGAAKVTGTYRSEVIDESAGRAAVAENVAGSKAADIEITIRTKDQVARKVEAGFAGGYKCAQKGAGGTVIGRLTASGGSAVLFCATRSRERIACGVWRLGTRLGSEWILGSRSSRWCRWRGGVFP